VTNAKVDIQCDGQKTDAIISNQNQRLKFASSHSIAAILQIIVSQIRHAPDL